MINSQNVDLLLKSDEKGWFRLDGNYISIECTTFVQEYGLTCLVMVLKDGLTGELSSGYV